MSTIKALRTRIKSVKSTQKITKAMRMVAASKLHKAKNAANFAQQYRDRIFLLLSIAQKNIDYSELSLFYRSMLTKKEFYKRTIAIVYSSDRGLCGAFNGTMYKKLKKDLCQYENLKIITIGKKLDNALSKIYNVMAHLEASLDSAVISSKVIDLIVKEVESDHDVRVVVYFTKFKNALVQTPSLQTIIPVEEQILDEAINVNLEFEGNNIVERICDLYLSSNFTANLFENRASEEASRMTAMDNATRNAGKMIDQLTLKMNRTRQSQITKELIEVISGAEAV